VTAPMGGVAGELIGRDLGVDNTVQSGDAVGLRCRNENYYCIG